MNKLYNQLQSDPKKQAFRITGYYFVGGIIWIILTDAFVNIMYNDNLAESLLESGKGLLYVTVTSALLYYFLKKYFLSLHSKNREARINEEKYRTLTENIDFAVIRRDKECRFTYINSAGRKLIDELIKQDIETELTGLTPEEVYKDPELAAEVRKNNKYVLDLGEKYKQKLTYGSKHFSYSLIPEFDQSGEIISVITLITDETESMNSLIKLEESEKFNRHLVDSSNVAVYIFDIIERKNNFSNEAIQTILGYTGEEIRLMSDKFLTELIHPDDIESFNMYFGTKVMNLKDGDVLELEYRMRHKNGNYCWFISHDCVFKRDHNGIPQQILGTAMDITDLKNTHNELKQKTEYMKAIIELSPMSIFDIDTDGRVLSIWNKASEEIYGWKAGEVMGKMLPIVPTDKLKEFREHINTNISGGMINGKELIREKMDGTNIEVKLYARPVTDKSGKVQSILSYNEDITIQKKSEAGLKKNEEYLKLLYEASIAANNIIDTGELYKLCFGFIESTLNVTGIMVSIVSDDRKFIKYDAIRVNGADIEVSNIPLMELKPGGKGPLTRTILTGKSLIVKDLEDSMLNSDNNFFVDTDGTVLNRDGSVENVSRASIMIPLKHEEKVIGVLQVQSYKTDYYTEEDLHKLEPFAFIFSSVMQRAKLYQKVQDEFAEKEIAFQQIRKFAKGIEQSPNSIVITNANYEIEFVNTYFTEVTGYTFEEVLGKNPGMMQSGLTKKEVYKDLRKTLSKGETWYGEFLNLKKNGDLFCEAASIGPITDSFGNITHFIAIKQDITEKKKKDKELKDSLEEKEIMLKEIHHRVKNNLQVISSLLNMQVDQYKNPDVIDAINSSRNRVKAMSLVHEILYKSHNISKTPLKEYIYMLAKNIYSSYGVTFEKVKFFCETFDIEFDLDTIIPLGLNLNEIISNSLKHGFPDNSSGQMEIHLKELSENEGKRNYELSVKDNGIGLPEGYVSEESNTLGMTLITSLAAQLDGEAIINNNAGTEVIIKFSEIKYKLKAHK